MNEDVHKRVERIDAEIEELERRVFALERERQSLLPTHRNARVRGYAPEELRNMNRLDACLWLLKQAQHPLSCREIDDGLEAAGYELRSADNVSYIGMMLHKRASTVGDVQSDGAKYRIRWCWVGSAVESPDSDWGGDGWTKALLTPPVGKYEVR